MKEGEGRTIQSQQDETDINLMVERWANGGVLGPVNERVPQYGDYSSVPTYQEAFDRIQQARDDFNELPSAVRKACNNDPATFIGLVHDPHTRAELEKLGLLKTRAPATAPEATPAEKTADKSATEATKTPQGGE